MRRTELPDPPLLHTGRTWRGSTRGATVCGRLLNARVVRRGPDAFRTFGFLVALALAGSCSNRASVQSELAGHRVRVTVDRTNPTFAWLPTTLELSAKLAYPPDPEWGVVLPATKSLYDSPHAWHEEPDGVLRLVGWYGIDSHFEILVNASAPGQWHGTVSYDDGTANPRISVPIQLELES